MVYKYAFKGYNKELMAKAVGISLSISTKQSVEICRFIRGKSLTKAKYFLEQVIKGKMAVPFKRYNKNIGHKPGMGPGRYPQKAAEQILSIVKSAESNAQSKGLNTSKMILRHICAHRASKPSHNGRNRGEMKRSHIEVLLEETKDLSNDAEQMKTEETKKTKHDPKKSNAKEDKHAQPKEN